MTRTTPISAWKKCYPDMRCSAFARSISRNAGQTALSLCRPENLRSTEHPRPAARAGLCYTKAMFRIILACGLVSMLVGGRSFAQRYHNPQPDERFKTDILVVVAHPDDETMIGSWLATQIFGHGRRVSVIFTTRGEQGANAVWPEQHITLGAVREIEARAALAHFNVNNVWFLPGVDTPSQNVLRSLGRWPHGTVLEELVRLMRLTRPEVVVTWLPAPIPSQHGDHQAAGVVATEAFDVAGDRGWFGEQVIDALDTRNISNFTDGLRPWQPKAVLYFSDGDLTGVTLNGPTFQPSGSPRASAVSYAHLAAEEQREHLTQSETGQAAATALASGHIEAFEAPVRFFWGKARCWTGRSPSRPAP